MLKLAITLLAAALCSAPAAKAAEAVAEKQDQPSFSQSIKKAYYDQEETYGTTAGYWYNYCEASIGVYNDYQIEPNQSHTVTAGTQTITSTASGFLYDLYEDGIKVLSGAHTSSYRTYAFDTSKYYWSFNTTLYDWSVTSTQTQIASNAWGTGVTNKLQGNNPAGGTIRIYYKLNSDQDDVYIEGITTTKGQESSGSWSKTYIAFTMPAENVSLELKTILKSDVVNENIFEAVGDTIEGLSTALTSPWEGLLNIFYDTTEQELTPFGEVSLIVAGTTLVFFLFGLVIALFRQRK